MEPRLFQYEENKQYQSITMFSQRYQKNFHLSKILKNLWTKKKKDLHSRTKPNLKYNNLIIISVPVLINYWRMVAFHRICNNYVWPLRKKYYINYTVIFWYLLTVRNKIGMCTCVTRHPDCCWVEGGFYFERFEWFCNGE